MVYVQWGLVGLVLLCGWGYLKLVGLLSAGLLASRGFAWVGIAAYVVIPTIVTVVLAVVAYFVPVWLFG
ncbi:hypothetical protein [Geopseudomonas aromaticivorans]